MTLKPALHTTFVFLLTSTVLACSGDSSDNGETDDTDDTVCNDTAAGSLEEGFVGDLSDNPASPTGWNLGAGTNELIAGTSTGDLDYVRVTVGNCDTLDSITVNAFSATGGDTLAFIAIQQGAEFTVTPDNASANRDKLYGYRHFGLSDINQDILAEMGQADNAIGFTSPVTDGTYSIWLNQLGPLSEYTLGFNVSRVSQ